MKPHEPFGRADAEEIEIAHRIVVSPRFDKDPVDLYQELLGKHGVESTGRIWSLACQLYDRDHPEGGE